MGYETLNVDVEDHVGVITLNRPDALNALNQQLLSELATALGTMSENDKVRCIVLTGQRKSIRRGRGRYHRDGPPIVCRNVFETDYFTEQTEAISALS